MASTVSQRASNPPSADALESRLAELLRLPPAELLARQTELSERLDTLSSSEHAALAPRLLELLDGAHLPDGPLRRRLVETVLRCGYPWALHLHPDDVAKRTRSVTVKATPKPLAVLLTLATLVAGVVGTVNLFQDRPPPPALLEAPPVSSTPATRAARHVAELRAAGLHERAEALAETCAVALPGAVGCLRQLEDMARWEASTTGDEFEAYRAGQFGELAANPANAVIREKARSLFTNEFAIDASFLSPSVDGAQAQLVEFVARGLELEVTDPKTLLGEAAACSTRRGQFGLVCRDFFERAWLRAPQETAVSPLTDDTPQTRAIAALRKMIDAHRARDFDEAIARGEACAAFATPEAASCRALLVEAYDARARTHANPEDRERDLRTANRWRTHLTGVPSSPRF